MIIEINEKQEVIFSASGAVAKTMTADNETTFEVETMPERESGKVLCYNPKKAEFYTTKPERKPIDEETLKARKAQAKERKEKAQKKAEALKWLADNDWKVNKRMLGEWAEDDERWLAYLEERKQMRAQYDEAIAE